MTSPWVIHLRNFASRNKMSYGCAMTDPRCKKEYHEMKEFAKRDTIEFTPTTKKQKAIKPIKKIKEGRNTFKKKVKPSLGWIYQFGENREEDKKFILQFTGLTKLKLNFDYYFQKKPVTGMSYEDESGDILYTIEVDNYIYDDLDYITMEFDEDADLDPPFEEKTFDKSNEFNTKLDKKEIEKFKQTSNYKKRAK